MIDGKRLLDQLVGSGVAGGLAGGLASGALANVLSGTKGGWSHKRGYPSHGCQLRNG